MLLNLLIFRWVFCEQLFTILSFLFWPLYCLSFFDCGFWLSHWYLLAFLTKSRHRITKSIHPRLFNREYDYIISGVYMPLGILVTILFNLIEGPSWPWSYGSWIYNHLCNQCVSPLNMWIRTPFMARFTRYKIMW